ncbi:hypothetical protein CBR_g468 [Chara braunii]|uniref:peptidyl-tRNA hydrolase n=1 Tax=Chara braunii TaxID=69332 RepID=A0A388KBA1_CHABU|nr:hypothetical protein CBR_g468 [Chara braunii]|eukprot:GBG67330.1 hypothetical protein CBR_g468 [Chara braunii]
MFLTQAIPMPWEWCLGIEAQGAQWERQVVGRGTQQQRPCRMFLEAAGWRGRRRSRRTILAFHLYKVGGLEVLNGELGGVERGSVEVVIGGGLSGVVMEKEGAGGSGRGLVMGVEESIVVKHAREEVSKGHVGFVGEGSCKIFVAYSLDAGDERKVGNDGGGEVMRRERMYWTKREKFGPFEEGVTWSSGGSAVADFSHPPFGGIAEEAGGGNGEPMGKGHVVEVKRVLELGGVLDAPDEGGGGGNETMVEVEGLVNVVVEVVGVEEVGGGVLLEAAVEEGVVCAVEEGGAAVVTTVMEGLFLSSVMTRSDMDDTVAFMSLREAVMEVWRVLRVWRMAERSGVAVFAGGCSPARLRAMLSTESVRMPDMLMEDAVMSVEEGVEDAARTDVEDAAAAMAEATAADEVEAGTAAAAAAAAAARWEGLMEPLVDGQGCVGYEPLHALDPNRSDGQVPRLGDGNGVTTTGAKRHWKVTVVAMLARGCDGGARQPQDTKELRALPSNAPILQPRLESEQSRRIPEMQNAEQQNEEEPLLSQCVLLEPILQLLDILSLGICPHHIRTVPIGVTTNMASTRFEHREEEALMYVPREEQEAAMKEWDAEEDPLKRQAIEDEKRMEWKLRLMRERKRRVDIVSQAERELEEVMKQRAQMEAQADLLGKVQVMARNIERLAQVLVVRADLKMTGGKIAAQCAHAALGAYNELLPRQRVVLKRWEACGQPKIVVTCKNQQEMNELKHSAQRAGLPTFIVSDAGKTQVAAGSKTVLAVGPGPKSTVDSVTRHLRLLH